MSTLYIDENNQPEPIFHQANNAIKAINMLYGIIAGITADQSINDDEVNFLNLWLKEHNTYTKSFPLNVIKPRVDEILKDSIITREEREDLYQTLSQIIGGTYQETGAPGGFSTAYGIDEPDTLTITGATFCLTGAFITGTRDKCEQIITELGGIPAKSVTKKLDYLVIGALASRDWVATSHGRKIEKAMYYREQGSQVIILSEETWAKFFQ